MVARLLRLCSTSSPLLLAALTLAAAWQPRTAHAQAQATGTKKLVGGDITYHFRLVDVSFEARYTSITGFSADESTYGGGFKFERAFNRFHPYVDLLIASGNIKFDHPEIYGNPNYTHDNSTVYDFGGGLDYDLVRNFAIKVDVQGQRWRIGVEQPAFEPYNGSIGILYRIPFRALRRR